jgi:hypothetical protein
VGRGRFDVRAAPEAVNSGIVGALDFHRCRLCRKALSREAVCHGALAIVALDPTLGNKVRYHPRGIGKRGRFYPSCSSQVLHQLTLAVIRNGHFFGFRSRL